MIEQPRKQHDTGQRPVAVAKARPTTVVPAHARATSTQARVPMASAQAKVVPAQAKAVATAQALSRDAGQESVLWESSSRVAAQPRGVDSSSPARVAMAEVGTAPLTGAVPSNAASAADAPPARGVTTCLVPVRAVAAGVVPARAVMAGGAVPLSAVGATPARAVTEGTALARVMMSGGATPARPVAAGAAPASAVAAEGAAQARAVEASVPPARVVAGGAAPARAVLDSGAAPAVDRAAPARAVAAEGVAPASAVVASGAVPARASAAPARAVAASAAPARAVAASAAPVAAAVQSLQGVPTATGREIDTASIPPGIARVQGLAIVVAEQSSRSSAGPGGAAQEEQGGPTACAPVRAVPATAAGQPSRKGNADGLSSAQAEVVPERGEQALLTAKSRVAAVTTTAAQPVSIAPCQTSAEGAAACGGAELLEVRVPLGVEAGQQLLLHSKDGRTVPVIVPDGLSAGDVFEVAFVPHRRPCLDPIP